MADREPILQKYLPVAGALCGRYIGSDVGAMKDRPTEFVKVVEADILDAGLWDEGPHTASSAIMVVMDSEKYLVSMLGEKANWVSNVKAASGKATLRHGTSEQVLLEEVNVKEKVPT